MGERDRPGRSDSWWRAQLSNLNDLFALSMTMFDDREAADIIQLAATSVRALGSCEAEAVYLVDDAGPSRLDGPGGPVSQLDEKVRALAGDSGRITLPDGAWRWGFALRGLGSLNGYLVVNAASDPTGNELFLLSTLSQQTGAALANARLLRGQRTQALQLRRLNEQLSASVAQLTQQTNVHNVLTRIATSGGGESGIATALHTLTGLQVAVEDQFGNLRAWGGPGQPDPYPKSGARPHADLLRRASSAAHPIRYRDRMVSLVKPRQKVLGVLALIDPERAAGAAETFALEYGTTVLALELAHRHSLAEVELRLRRDLVDDLITGTDEDSALARADALGHDLRVPHHVVAVRWDVHGADDAVAQATNRAATTLKLNALGSRRSDAVVLLVDARPDGQALYRLLVDSLGSTGAVGVGSRCDTPRDLPRSYTEAMRAVNIRRRSPNPHGATMFDQMGVYRILDNGSNHAEMVTFVRDWLGPLLDYDEQRNADLVRTLSYYLECGGNYDNTASALTIHRSTLRYRLGRIRELTELDLNDVDSRLNLHVAARAWQVLNGSE
ncbi:MAG TPA: helix-turn-helix domain-containing protein [Pseudonocardiaceae bacterium]